MKIVAVSQRVDHYPDRNERRDALDQRLVTFLLVAGFAPVPVPNGLFMEHPDGRLDHSALDRWLAAVSPQALVLSGGNDLGQCRERDLTEGWLLDHARRQRLPVLGICRGMQMMAHWAGTGLHVVHGHVKTRHRVSGKLTGEVNSYHAFALAACPDGFEVLARSEDGQIEAIRHQSLPWEGWMWHPEREENFASRDVQGIRALFGG
jgi:putative glutamine amidotransferase